MKVLVIMIIVAVVLLVVAWLYALMFVSAESDEEQERWIKEWMDKHGKGGQT